MNVANALRSLDTAFGRRAPAETSRNVRHTRVPSSKKSSGKILQESLCFLLFSNVAPCYPLRSTNNEVVQCIPSGMSICYSHEATYTTCCCCKPATWYSAFASYLKLLHALGTEVAIRLDLAASPLAADCRCFTVVQSTTRSWAWSLSRLEVIVVSD